jgi:type I restriction enzyme S subunit
MEKQQSKKLLIRFPEFKDAWEHKQLNELLSEAKKRNEDLKYGKDEVLSVSGELGIVNQIEHLGRSYAGVSVHQYHVVEVGDIVYTKSPLKANPFGIIKLNKGKAGIVSTLYAVYKVNQQTAYGPFIDCYFSLDANTNRYLRPLVRKGAKNTLQVTNEEAISAEMFAPTIPEQKRIASFFTVLDKKIAELKQKKSLLEQYKTGVMQKLFSQELRFKDENGREFTNWEEKRLEDFGDLIHGDGDWILSKDLSDEGRYKIIQLGNIGFGKYVNKPLKTISDETFNVIKGTPIRKGDLLISRMVDDNLNCCIFNLEGDYITSVDVCWIRENNFFINYFLMLIITHRGNQNKLLNLSSGSGRVRISKNNLFREFSFLLPSEKEQIVITNFISKIDVKINQTENQIYQTQQYKKGLLQKMFI